MVNKERVTREKFMKVIIGLAEGFSVETTDGQLEMYWYALSDIPFETLRQACLEATKTCEKFPVPAVLRKLAKPIAESTIVCVRCRQMATGLADAHDGKVCHDCYYNGRQLRAGEAVDPTAVGDFIKQVFARLAAPAVNSTINERTTKENGKQSR